MVRCGLLLAVLGWTLASCAAPAPPAPPTVTVMTRPSEPTRTPEPTTSARGAVIDAVEQYFNPPTLTVPVGTSVLWRDLQGTHDVVAYDGTFASAVMVEGGTYSFTFTRPGHYAYLCTLHEGAGMLAEIYVEAG
jgi:plastocyanin